MPTAAVALKTQGSLVNQALGASQRVTQAIKQASSKAGVDFAYLLNKASQESSLNPTAKSSSSSATGLFQFIEQTWLRTVKTYGSKYGLSEYAERIMIGSDGVARVKDTGSKQAILAMRKDPAISACMAAELTNENKAALQNGVGGKIGSTELYLAHFLGVGGACDFIKNMRSNPNATAANVLPEAASSNPSVFYDKAGQPRSLNQIYKYFANKFSRTPSVDTTKTAVADASSSSLSKSYGSFDALNVPSQRTTCSPSVTSTSNFGLDSATSSTLATMILSQMDMGKLTPSFSAGPRSGEEETKRKSALSTLAGIIG